MIRQRGFTLMEVMVAMVIVAIALPALLMQMGKMTSEFAHARDKAVAHWVAENKMQELKLDKEMRGGQVPTGRQADDVDMAGYTWDWSTETTEMNTGFVEVFQVRIDVRKQGEEYVLASLTAYFIKGT